MNFIEKLVSKITIENKKGTYKSFQTDDDPVGEKYPLKGMTYPVDYGCIDGYMGQDGADLDVFVGSVNDADGLNGCIEVWRCDVPVETKFFINLSQSEMESVLEAFKPVLLSHRVLADDEFGAEINRFSEEQVVANVLKAQSEPSLKGGICQLVKKI